MKNPWVFGDNTAALGSGWVLFLVLSPNPHRGFLALRGHPEANLSAPSPNCKVQPSGMAFSNESAPRTYIVKYRQVASLDLPIVEVRVRRLLQYSG